MESGNVLLSQVFPHVLNPPQAAHTGEPNQVQCRTLVRIIWKTKLSDCMKRKTHPHGQVFLFMESGNVLLSQVFPHVLNPPQAAHTGEPNQVQCWTLA